MRIVQAQLPAFRRFADLTITGLSPDARLVLQCYRTDSFDGLS
jgi:hypothetical protein